MLAVLKRELKSNLCTVSGPLFVAVNLFFLGIYFTVYHLSMGYADVAYTIQSVLFVFLIMVPVLSMRSMADERRQKTDQLLFTAPVSSFRIILGKYLGMVSVFAIPVLVLCTYPLLLGMYGKVEYPRSYVAILAYFLFGCTCLAVGLFVSSLTENLIIASVGTFAILLLCYLMSGIRSLISESGNLLTRILVAFDLSGQLTSLMQGVLNLRAILYYLLVTALMLFYTCQSVNKRRYEFGKKTAGFTILSGMGTLVVTAAVAGIYIASGLLPDSYKNIDVTENKLYEITDTTKTALAGISEDVTIYVLAAEDTYDETIKQLLYRYKDGSPRLNVEYKDMTVNPDFAKQFGVEEATDGSLIVVSPKRSKYIHYSDMYQTEFDYSTYSQKATGFDGEGQLTAALDYVLNDDLPTIYVVTGHDELGVSGTFADMLAKANIETQEVNLMTGDLTGAAAIFMISPTVDYSEDDVKKVRDYLEAGGSALIISSFSDEKLTNFDSLMADYGVTLEKGIVAEGDQNMFYQMPTYLLPEIMTDTITTSLISDKRLVLMPYAQGAVVDKADEDGLNISKLLVTSDASYTKADTQNAQSLEKEAGDKDGPFTVGLYLEKERDSGSTKILYFTTESILDEGVNQMVGGSDLELVMNGVSELAGEEEKPSAVSAKSFESESIVVPRSTAIAGGALLTGIIPLIILLGGILVWNRRRKL